MRAMRMLSRFGSLVLLAVILSACGAAASTPGPFTSTPSMPADTPTPSASTPTPVPDALLPAEDPPPGAERQFSTDFSRRSVPYSEILSGGPPKDGIPAIDEPQSVTVGEADN